MDKDKLAKLQQQVRIGMSVSTIHMYTLRTGITYSLRGAWCVGRATGGDVSVWGQRGEEGADGLRCFAMWTRDLKSRGASGSMKGGLRRGRNVRWQWRVVGGRQGHISRFA